MLLALFCVRVLAQLIQAVYPLSFLPAFSAWQSGALPYGMLLASQVLIVGFCTTVIWGLIHGTINAASRKGSWYLYGGGIYFGIMILRLVIGLTIAPDHFWFNAHLPTLFHLVLATFVIVYGHFHYTSSEHEDRSNT